MSEPFIGEIRIIGFNFAPRGWAICEGQLLSINQYQALFSLLGTTFGGDGGTTFGLPDLRGRVPVGEGSGAGLSNVNWGQKSGTNTETLTIAQMPSHTHAATLHAESDTANSGNPNGRMFATPANPIYAEVDTGNIDRTFASQTLVVPNTGGGQSHNNMQPFLGLYIVIALQGLFPSRS